MADWWRRERLRAESNRRINKPKMLKLQGNLKENKRQQETVRATKMAT